MSRLPALNRITVGPLVARFAGMVEAEMRMRAGAGSAATAAIGKREGTQGRAVL